MKFYIRILLVIVAAFAAFVILGCSAKQTSKKSQKEKVVVKKDQPAKKGNKAAKPAPSGGSTPVDVDKLLGIAPKDSSGASGLSPLGTPGAPPVSVGLKPGAKLPVKAAPIKPNVRPTPEQLLMAVRARYGMSKTMRISGVSSAVVKYDGKIEASQKNQKFSMLFKRPNMFVINENNNKVVSDGSNIYDYSSASNRFAKMKMDDNVLKRIASGQPGVGVVGLLMRMDYSPMFDSMKLLPDAKIGGRDVFVLKFSLKPGVAAPKGMTGTQTLWIGKKDLGVYKSSLITSIKPQAPKGYKGKVPKNVQSEIVTTLTNFEPDAKLSDASFKFQVPAGAKQAEAPKIVNVLNKPAPDIEMKWIDGTSKKLSDFKGKTVVLYFWALPHAEKGLASIQAFYDKKKDDLQFIGINLNDKPQEIEQYLQKNNFSFPSVPTSDLIDKIAMNQYGIMALPTLIIIDEQGIIRGGLIGNPQLKEIEAKLDKISAK